MKCLFLVILLAISGVFAEKVNITCKEAAINCSNKVHYTYTANVSNSIQSMSSCGQLSQCKFNILQVHAFYCQYDIFGYPCKSKTCMLPVQKNFCANRLTSTCPVEETNVLTKCGDCLSGKDICGTGMCGMTGQKQICYPSMPCVYGQMAVDYIKCPNNQDYKGSSCDCCARFCVKEQVGICMNSEDFSNTDFSNFAFDFYNTSCFQTNLQKTFVLLLIALLITMF